MNFLNFLKDLYNRKKLIRLHKPWSIRSYDLRREIALFWDTPAYMPENSNKEQYEQLVAVNGFGASGSSAVTDFLAEFSEITALGGAYSFSNPNRKDNQYECTFVLENGSILSLEENIYHSMLKNPISRKAALEFSIYILRNYHSNIYIYDEYYLQRSKKFLFDLIEHHWRYSLKTWYIPCVEFKYTPPRLQKRILIDDPLYTQIVDVLWKKIDKKDFRKLAKEYIKDFLKHIPSKKFLLCDQLIIGYEYKHNQEFLDDYFDNLKLIFTWRDPRDQYATFRNRHMDMRVQTPEAFIEFYKRSMSGLLEVKHENFLLIRFEELVLNYDKTTKEIIDFLGLDLTKHTKKFEFFDPKVSIKKIGSYKTYHDQEAIKIIERELSEYCWNK